MANIPVVPGEAWPPKVYSIAAGGVALEVEGEAERRESGIGREMEE